MPITETGECTPTPVAPPSPSPMSPLQGLLEVTRLVRAEEHLPELLDAIARTIAESLGYETVVVNLYRPAWDDFTVTTVHGSAEAAGALLGQVRSVAEWEHALCDTFLRRGAYVVPAGSYDWRQAGYSYVPPPSRSPSAQRTPGSPRTRSSCRCGTPTAICSASSPSTSPPAGSARPTRSSTCSCRVADHAALAVQAAQEAADAARHRLALEQLLDVSSRLTAEPVADEILRDVCRGVRDALGFQNVARRSSSTRRAAASTHVRPSAGDLDGAGAAARSSSSATSSRCSIRRSRSRAASCCPNDEAEARLSHDSASRTSRSTTGAARTRGTTTGCSSRCTTAPAT